MSKFGTSIVGPTSSHCQRLLDITRFSSIFFTITGAKKIVILKNFVI